MSAATDPGLGVIEAEPAQTWCDKCPEPSAMKVTTDRGEQWLCREHGSELLFKLHSANFNGGKAR